MVEDIKTTEQLIFDSALQIFQKKGLAGARMQEIADLAGINKSMLHYYYRSKEQLFTAVFMQSFKQFLGGIIPILNREDNTWEDKIGLVIEHYAVSLQANQDLPLFVINELRLNPEQYVVIVKEQGIKNTIFIRQIQEAIERKEIRPVMPIQIFITVVSGIMFPYLAEPLIKHLGNIPNTSWDAFMNERKVLIREMLVKYLKEF